MASSSRPWDSSNLASLLHSITGGSLKSRASALDDLNYLLDRKGKGNGLPSLEDKTYHQIFEALFQCAVTEKQVALGGTKSTSASAATRLAKCCKALRAAVEHAVNKLRRKTTLAVVDHITQTLAGPDGDFVEAMAQDYIKTLLILLSRQANVEQLAKHSAEGWVASVEFCTDAISRYLDQADQDTSLLSRGSPAPGTAQTLSLSRSTGRSSSNPMQRLHGTINQGTLLDLLECLHYLVLAPNAPLQATAQQIIRPILKVLQIRQFKPSRIQQYSFAAITAVLASIEADDLFYTRTIAKELIPMVCHWWHAQMVAKDEMLKSVRDEMLRAIFAVNLHLEYLAQNPDHESFQKDIEDLLDVLWSEYSRRDAVAQLRLDDLNFGSAAVPNDYFRTPIFSLLSHNKEGERKWAVLHCISLLESVLYKTKRRDRPSSVAGEQPRKRRRTAHEPNRLRRQLKSLDPRTQLTALQLLPFLVHTKTFEDEEVWDVLADLALMISDKQGVVSSWALLGCASCALRKDASDESHAATWKQIWQISVRTVSMLGTSRAACVLLHTILEAELAPYHSIAEDITNIVTTADINGPAILSDASLRLMLHLLQLRNSKLPSASQSTCNHVIRWVFLKWNPADLTFASLHSPHVSSLDLVNLLRVCCGVGLQPTSGPKPVSGGPLSQAWKSHCEGAKTVRYLLLLDDPEPMPQIPVSCNQKGLTGDAEQTADPASFFTSKKLLLELLYPKLEELHQICDSWNKRASDGGQQISAERLQSLFAVCMCSAMLLSQLTDLNSMQSRDVEPALFKLVDETFAAVLESMESQVFLDILLRTARSYMPALTTVELNRVLSEHPHLVSLFSKLAGTLHDQKSRQSSGQNPDFMDIDDDFDSQVSKASTVSRLVEVPRNTMSMSLDSAAFYLDTTLRLYLLEALSADSGQVGLVPDSFLDHLLALTDEEFLLCRSVLLEALNSDLIIGPNNAFRLVEKIGGVIGRVPDYDCCEVALSTCLDVIHALLPVWSDDTSDLGEMVGDLYHHLVKTALPDNMLAPRAQVSLAQLLLSIMKVDTQYADKLKLSSCRSTLLLIDQGGPVTVKFFVGANVSDMFGLYVLKVHDDIFVDVLDNLPTDPDCIEGIAYRVFVFAELARRWPTLLRRCIYHIFETPGEIPSSTKYATRCLTRVATALNLKSPKELFRLFAPQILYTWMPSHSIDHVPYSIFGFESLSELLNAVQTEASALMMMRGQEAEFQHLASQLSKNEVTVVSENFSKIMAYAIAHDFAKGKKKPDQSSSSSAGSVESSRGGESVARVKKRLGSQPFLEASYSNFADIVAHFMDLFDQEDDIEKHLVGQLSYAADALAEIKKFSHSEVGLPPNQQPVFKARHMLRQLNQLCILTPKYDFLSMWTPALVVFVARKLINTVHPALGSLHACSVLRKLRVLICLAGPVAWGSYPLEMLLHSVRAFMVDSECADDAMGISQYLITRGTPHLEQAPSFLAGYALSTLASLRVFLESSQSSTTQESQFRATMSKAKQFHSWFTKYLKAYSSPVFKDDARREDSFRSITQSAAHIRSSGNADKGTHESSLLLEILRDEDQDEPLLNESARDLALGLLCGDFRLPASNQADIIETDEDAMQQGRVVWRSCKAQALSDQYLAWAGRVAGRSFAASGEVPDELLQESRLGEYQRIAPGLNGSQRGLLYLLQGLTMHKDPFTAGLAESALRSSVSEARVAEDDVLIVACQETLTESLCLTSDWGEYYPPPSENPSSQAPPTLDERVFSLDHIEKYDWVQRFALYLAQSMADKVIVLAVLAPVLREVKGFAEHAFPFILHLVLVAQLDRQQSIKRKVSESFKDWLAVGSQAAKDNQKLIINTILYLRTQQFPAESSVADRAHWLDVDLSSAAHAAARCGMHKTALLFIEMASTESTRSSRRSSAAREQDASDLLLNIFENIDDPDAYYGLGQSSSLSTVLARLEYEQDGAKSLAFRGAQYDSHIRRRDPASESDGQAIVKALGTLGLSGLSHSLLQTQQSLDGASTSLESTFKTARRLEMWNLPAPTASSNYAVTEYKAFQSIHQATDLSAMRRSIHDGFGDTMRALVTQGYNAASLRQHLGSLAVLTELDDVLNVTDFSDLEKNLGKFETRNGWMRRGRYDDVSHILSCRETTLSMLSQKPLLRGRANISEPQARQVEIRSMLMDSGIYRFHQATQESLNLSTTLTDLIEPCEGLGLNVDAAIRIEAANSLWDHGEMASSIGLLQSIDNQSNLKKQTVPVSRPDLLSKIGHQVSLARLEKPDDIQKKYLEPALKELKGKLNGKEAGQVFHQFAMFCDEQLQNPDGLEDLARLQSLQKGKSDEVAQLRTLITSTRDSQVKNKYSHHLTRAKQWLDLDEQELRRVEQTRNEFVRLSLENYLLSLSASDAHNNDALRFTALWLERSDEDATNDAVNKHLDKVPTRKFAGLMNQLSSRLQDEATLFQKLLFHLVLNICIDHPYHAMYHIWAGTYSRVNKKDEVALSRSRATTAVAKDLGKNREVSSIWMAIDRTSKDYHKLASDRSDKYKQNAKIPLKSCHYGQGLLTSLAKYKIPPPTMQLEVSADRDYSRVPIIATLDPQMTIASGVSAPKIITAIGSDGKKYKQLVKGGNDELRQDAIMEQVFAAVSSLLKLHRATQQRNLGIRTYKVLPLTSTSGLIEFVSNTIPLHEFLIPAHERYYPKDYKASQCRREIAAAQGKSADQRMAAYRRVTEKFHPVMRYFFMEYFVDPDEWFVRRLAYTRTTAAISMLGHVLGLGDRHGHNILLDSKTGEVVHIDLGVAFEMGRVLPVPELVPFRLTRDIVDGMGLSGTEGIFRRCCEFTLDALREETYSIMTILDVLRYDPLYSWSISPVRLAKLQDAAHARQDEGEGDEDEEGGRRRVNEPSEADRALEVVRKKLSKTLSVTATVNDLINQASDERNLAVLYSGWAAYA